jgi:ribose transport system permease protein
MTAEMTALRADRLASFLGSAAALAPLLIFLALLLYLGIAAPRFLTLETLALILKQSAPIIVVSLGLATVVIAGCDDIVSGGIDLSIPGVAVLCGAVIAELTAVKGAPIAVGLAAGLATAVIAGLVNAWLVVRIGMTPLLATLASFTAYVGLANYVTTSRRVNISDPLIVFLRDGTLGAWPAGVVIALASAAIVGFAVHRTRWGLNLQAVGGGREAAAEAGLSPHKFIAAAFLIAALAGGVGSTFLLARGSGFAPGVEENLQLEMILATFLGPVFSLRKVVTIWGATLGAVLVSALTIGLGSAGIDIFWTGCVKGALILVVVASSAASRGRYR